MMQSAAKDGEVTAYEVDSDLCGSICDQARTDGTCYHTPLHGTERPPQGSKTLGRWLFFNLLRLLHLRSANGTCWPVQGHLRRAHRGGGGKPYKERSTETPAFPHATSDALRVLPGPCPTIVDRK